MTIQEIKNNERAVIIWNKNMKLCISVPSVLPHLQNTFITNKIYVS